MKTRSPQPTPFHIEQIGPWKSQKQNDEQGLINNFCNQALRNLANISRRQHSSNIKNSLSKNDFGMQRIRIRNRRPFSNAQPNRDQQEQSEILSHSKSKQNSKIEKSDKKQTRRPLQEIIAQNFVLEGSREKREIHFRKKQPSYILKQKFAEIRRSMNTQLGTWGNFNQRLKSLTRDENDSVFRCTRQNSYWPN